MQFQNLTKPALTILMSAALALQGAGVAYAGPEVVGDPDVDFVPDSFVDTFLPPTDVFPSASDPAGAAGSTNVGAQASGAGTATVAPPAGVTLVTANAAATQFISLQISDSYAVCSLLPEQEYAVDCLGERMAELAKALPASGDYVEAKAVLENTSKRLRAVAQKNKSTTKRPARITTTVRNKKVKSGVLTPVKPEAIKPAMAEAVTILDEASTVLLRSVGNSERRKVDYQKIAVAIGSNKRLLRSA